MFCISKRLQLSHGSLSGRAFVQAALALTGGREIVGALEGFWLVGLSRSALITGQAEMLEFISLEIRS